MTPEDVEALARCMGAHGVAVFPADTVYGLACQPDEADAVRRLYRLKRRRPDKPAAVMFFDRDLALAALPDIGERTGGALESGPGRTSPSEPARRCERVGRAPARSSG